MKELQYRHEYKYPLTRGQILLEEAKISSVVSADAHAGEKGFYNIRSLYFDDYDNSCFWDNENGTDNREKFRIRIYNCNRKFIRLELKRKYRGKTNKESCPISLEQCELLMKGVVPSDISREQQVLQKLAYLMETRLMKPVVIVEYDRIPYVYRPEDANVRITFDKNITAISDIDAFFEPEAAGRGVMPEGQELMEVKFDDFLPDEIYSLLQLNGLQASAFSKYYLCRKFMMKNNSSVLRDSFG